MAVSEYTVKLCTQLHKQRLSGQFCDVTMTASTTEYQAHSSVLSACSEFFTMTFLNLPQADKYVLSLDISDYVDHFDDVLSFMYLGSINITEDNVFKTLHLANTFLIPELVASCSQYLVDNLTIHNCLFNIELSKTYQLSSMLSDCVSYLKVNIVEVLKSVELLEISFDQIKSLMTEYDFSVTESQKIWVITQWLSHDIQQRCTCCRELWLLIQWDHMNIAELTEILQTDSLYIENKWYLMHVLLVMHEAGLEVISEYQSDISQLVQIQGQFKSDALDDNTVAHLTVATMVGVEACAQVGFNLEAILQHSEVTNDHEVEHVESELLNQSPLIRERTTNEKIELQETTKQLPIVQETDCLVAGIQANPGPELSGQCLFDQTVENEAFDNGVSQTGRQTTVLLTTGGPASGSQETVHQKQCSQHPAPLCNSTDADEEADCDVSYYQVMSGEHSTTNQRSLNTASPVETADTCMIDNDTLQQSLQLQVKSNVPTNKAVSWNAMECNDITIQRPGFEQPKNHETGIVISHGNLSSTDNDGTYDAQTECDGKDLGTSTEHVVFLSCTSTIDSSVLLDEAGNSHKDDQYSILLPDESIATNLVVMPSADQTQDQAAQRNSSTAVEDDNLSIGHKATNIDAQTLKQCQIETTTKSGDFTNSGQATIDQLPLPTEQVMHNVEPAVEPSGSQQKSSTEDQGTSILLPGRSADDSSSGTTSQILVADTPKKVITTIVVEPEKSKEPRAFEEVAPPVRVCDWCSTEFTSSHHLYRHIRKQHFSGAPYHCDFKDCAYKNMQLQTLIVHRRKHTRVRPWVCSFCDESFRTKRVLQIHIRKHTGYKPNTCETCERSFSTLSALVQHQVTHSDARPYSCTQCTFSTKYQAHLTSHNRIHSGNVYKCTHDGCKYETPKQGQLNAHLKIHQKIRPHICSVCDKSFIEATHLRRHERIHLDIKPFRCLLCSFSTARRDKLKEHNARHQC